MGGRFAIERRGGGGRLLALEVLGGLAGLAYVGWADPHDPSTRMPACPIKAVSGWDCPACGGLRMVHDLFHGDLRAAVRDNPFLLAVSPFLFYLLFEHARALRSGRPPTIPRRIAYGLLAASLAWTVVRNRPRRSGQAVPVT